LWSQIYPWKRWMRARTSTIMSSCARRFCEHGQYPRAESDFGQWPRAQVCRG
jgi:hypothetical protein